MEQLRQLIMDCLAEFFDEDEPERGGSGCFALEEHEATMLAIIQTMREKLADQDRRIKELEKRQPVQWSYPVTYPAPSNPNPIPTTDCPVPWWERNQFTCKY